MRKEVSIIFITILFFMAASATPEDAAIDSLIRTICGCTRYPDPCYTSLTSSNLCSTKPQCDQYLHEPYLLAGVAVKLSLSDAKKASKDIQNLNKNTKSSILHQCVENLKDTVDQIKASLHQMASLSYSGRSDQEFKFNVSNVKTWMSAAMTDDDTCADELVRLEEPTRSNLWNKAMEVEMLISNALALVNKYYP
ncbi:hypothetical protein OROHE_002258 [Orobanche hederae]